MYEFSAKIRYSETDSEGKLAMESLLDYFQDSSTFQSEELGRGVKYLKQNKLAWVLSAWQIVVERFPMLCEEVVIGTFPYQFKGFLGSRNFYMKDKEGTRIACANSLWTLVNTETMKPVMPSEEMLTAYELEPKLEMNYLPRKIVIPGGEDGAEALEAEEIVVRRQHLDTNHHVNNGQYIRMAMGFLPEDIQILQLRAEYKKQAFLGDVIHPLVLKKEDTYVVSLQDEQGVAYVNVEVVVK